MKSEGNVHLDLSPDSLVVFVDDTGHEALVKGHPVYGLGGCAVMGYELDQLIRHPWREVRQKITGSADSHLHASEFGQGASKEQIQVVADFFHSQPFRRIGAIISTATILAEELGPVPTIATVLRQRIIEVARGTNFQDLHVIFESSERADPQIEKAFRNLEFYDNGPPISVEWYFMKKSAGEPGLEVADFIMHAVGRQARHWHGDREGFVPDFTAVFHSVEEKLANFMMIDSVTVKRDG